MALVTWANQGMSDDLVDHPGPGLAVALHPVGAANARLLFHHQAAEQTRRNYELWEIVQIALGSLFFLFLLFGTGESKIVLATALAMVALVLAQRIYISPNIASVGRVMDFLPPGAQSPWSGKLSALWGFYAGAEIAKWLIQLAMASRFIAGRQAGDSERIRNYVNPIDKTNYRHVNR
jgi:hypothetical protein